MSDLALSTLRAQEFVFKSEIRLKSQKKKKKKNSRSLSRRPKFVVFELSPSLRLEDLELGLFGLFNRIFDLNTIPVFRVTGENPDKLVHPYDVVHVS